MIIKQKQNVYIQVMFIKNKCLQNKFYKHVMFTIQLQNKKFTEKLCLQKKTKKMFTDKLCLQKKQMFRKQVLQTRNVYKTKTKLKLYRQVMFTKQNSTKQKVYKQVIFIKQIFTEKLCLQNKTKNLHFMFIKQKQKVYIQVIFTKQNKTK